MVQEIALTRGLIALVDDGDYERLSQFKWSASVISPGRAYGRTCIIDGSGKTRKLRWLYMHRAILQPPDELVVDHIDGDGVNNRRGNLRVCRSIENHANRRSISSSSGFKGVNWDEFEYGKGRRYPSKRPWRAKIKVRGKLIQLGRFENPQSAADAYDAAATQYFGEFAATNRELRA